MEPDSDRVTVNSAAGPAGHPQRGVHHPRGTGRHRTVVGPRGGRAASGQRTSAVPGAGRGSGPGHRASSGHSPDRSDRAGGRLPLLPVPAERRVVVRAGPLTSASGAVVGAVATFQDVTALHDSHRLLTRKAAEMSAVFQATRAVLRDDNAREAVCHAAASVLGSDGRGRCSRMTGTVNPAATTAVGADMLGMRIPQNSSAVVAEVFSSARTRTLSGLTADKGVDQDVVRRLSELCGRPLNSGAWIPVVAGGRCLAGPGPGLRRDSGRVGVRADLGDPGRRDRRGHRTAGPAAPLGAGGRDRRVDLDREPAGRTRCSLLRSARLTAPASGSAS